MHKTDILKKFGSDFAVNADTFIMGIHYRFGEHIGKKFAAHQIVLDACLGAGFTTLHIAKNVEHVIAVDINEEHLNLAKGNALKVGIADKITFLHGSVIDPEVLEKIQNIDAAFLDPDWAATRSAKTQHVSKLAHMQPNGDILFNLINQKTHNIAYRLPKEFDLKELTTLPTHSVESFIMDGKLKFYCDYFGDLTSTSQLEEFKIDN